jgi:hypothetical protein
MGTVALEETSVCLFADEREKIIFYPEDGGSCFFRNIGFYPHNYAASHPRMLQFWLLSYLEV